MLSEIYGWFTKARHRREQVVKRPDDRRLKNLTDPGVRRLLNRVKQLVAFDGHIEVWADGPSFANAIVFFIPTS